MSAYVCTVRLPGRLLSRMAGGRADAGIGEAALAAVMPANGPREFYVPAVREADRVRPLEWKGSADIYTFAAADCLIIRAENAAAAEAGERVAVLNLRGD